MHKPLPNPEHDLTRLHQQAKSRQHLPILLYLAQPYSHPDPAVVAARAQAGVSAAVWLINNGQIVYSPIAQSQALEAAGAAPAAGWYGYDLAVLRRCQGLLVLELPGWQHSAGVRMEIAAALALDLPIRFADPAHTGVPTETIRFLEQANQPEPAGPD